MSEETRASGGRPRSFDSDEVLDRALELFWKNGYAATTTRALETELGLTQSSLYNAFGSKRELLERTLVRYQEKVTSKLLVPLEDSPDGLSSLSRFFQSLATWIASDGRRGCMLINLMAEDGGKTDAVSAQTRGYRARMRRGFRGALKRAKDAKEIADEDLGAKSELLVGLVLGLNIAARGGAAPAELRGISRAAKTLIQGWKL